MNSGGLNPESDIRCEAETIKMYKAIRNRKTDWYNIAMNTEFTIEQTQAVKAYLFYSSHLLRMGYARFAPCFEIAQSWLRLSEKTDKNIQYHDRLLLYHELYEMDLLLNNTMLSQSEAHDIAQSKYNYLEASKAFYNKRC